MVGVGLRFLIVVLFLFGSVLRSCIGVVCVIGFCFVCSMFVLYGVEWIGVLCGFILSCFIGWFGLLKSLILILSVCCLSLVLFSFCLLFVLCSRWYWFLCRILVIGFFVVMRRLRVFGLVCCVVCDLMWKCYVGLVYL